MESSKQKSTRKDDNIDSPGVDSSAIFRIKSSYHTSVKDTISALKMISSDMADGHIQFANVSSRRYQYNPAADSTLYASHLLHAASILEFLLIDNEGELIV
jgi:hypothetical protein